MCVRHHRIGRRCGALVCCGALLLGGCGAQPPADASLGTVDAASAVTEIGEYSVRYTDKDTDTTVPADAPEIRLEETHITSADAAGVQVQGATATITAGGTYRVAGTLTDGQLVVNAPEDEVVRLVLDGVTLTCQSSAAVWVQQAKKVVLVLAEGSANTLTDGTDYVTAEDGDGNGPNAAVYSKADLTVTGAGALTVNGRCSHGLVSKDKLKITGGTVTVSAVRNGIKGKDCVAIRDGVVTVTAGKDGIKSTNTAEVEAGFIRMDGGTVTVTADEDGLQAETGLVVAGGTLTVTSGGGSANGEAHTEESFFGRRDDPNATATTTETTSRKGLKAALALVVSDGSITVDAADDALHSNGVISITGGTLSLSSGDDGVHADDTLHITGGDLTVHRSYEGLEALVILIEDGRLHITASDDGINAAGGSDDENTAVPSSRGRFGMGGATEGAALTISGGYTVIDAGGDGLDSNDVITMTGGVVLVYGPTDSANGAIDYETGFTMDGGTLVAAGSSGMAESVTAGDAHALFVTTSTQAAGVPVWVTDSDGQTLIAVAPLKAWSSLVVSTPAMTEGAAYTVTIGGTYTGEVTDGIISGTCDGGEASATVTLTGASTALRVGSGGQDGGWLGGGRPDNQNPADKNPSNGYDEGATPPDGDFEGVTPPDGEFGDMTPPDGDFGDMTPPDGDFGDMTPPDGADDGRPMGGRR